MALSLFRKYRPETFADFVGQEHIANTLRRAVATNTTADAYLFSGPRGTGKTSTARLLAKALLCEHPFEGEPDDSCAQCREIALGIHPDVYELDAASRTGVDNVREEIISRVAFAPIRGSYKIYIIDEVHMLSTAAFNALLKTLEEPPAHIKFILCTTDPFKVPQTIQSRCQRFDFRRFSTEEIIGNLRRVSTAEGFKTDDQVLALIAAHAQGGMRDALVSLEQIAVFSNGELSLDATISMLGQVRPEQLQAASASIATRDVSACLALVADLVQSGTDIAQFCRELTRHLRNLYITLTLQGKSNAASVYDNLDLQQGLDSQAQAFGSLDRLAACLALAADLNQQLKTAGDERLVLELALIRMARPDTDLSMEALSARISMLEQKLENAKLPEAALEMDIELSSDTEQASDDDIKTTGASMESKPVLYQMMNNDSDAQRLWSAVISQLEADRQSRLAGLLNNARACLDHDTGGLMIELPTTAAFTKASLEQAANRKILEEYTRQLHGEVLPISYKLGYGQPVSAETTIPKPEISASASSTDELATGDPASAESLLTAAFGTGIVFEPLPTKRSETNGFTDQSQQ